MGRVVIIGAGEIGTAIAHVIRVNTDVVLWDTDPARMPNGVKPLDETVRGANVVFLCIPSRAIRDAARELAPLVGKGTVIVSLAKGLEVKTSKTMDAVLKESFSDGQPIALLGGPLLAEEIRIGKPGIGVMASHERSAFDTVLPLFAGTSVTIEYETNTYAVALASVCKNIYAIGLGIAEGLDWGWNGKGWLAGCAIREMTDVVLALGGTSDVARGTAGIGDVLATGMSAHSKNRTTGLAFARTGECENPGEGCRAVGQILELLRPSSGRYPLMTAIDRIVNKNEPARTVFEEFRAR